jgi:hypothetical protein
MDKIHIIKQFEKHRVEITEQEKGWLIYVLEPMPDRPNSVDSQHITVSSKSIGVLTKALQQLEKLQSNNPPTPPHR